MHVVFFASGGIIGTIYVLSLRSTCVVRPLPRGSSDHLLTIPSQILQQLPGEKKFYRHKASVINVNSIHSAVNTVRGSRVASGAQRQA